MRALSGLGASARAGAQRILRRRRGTGNTSRAATAGGGSSGNS